MVPSVVPSQCGVADPEKQKHHGGTNVWSKSKLASCQCFANNSHFGKTPSTCCQSMTQQKLGLWKPLGPCPQLVLITLVLFALMELCHLVLPGGMICTFDVGVIATIRARWAKAFPKTSSIWVFDQVQEMREENGLLDTKGAKVEQNTDLLAREQVCYFPKCCEFIPSFSSGWVMYESTWDLRSWDKQHFGQLHTWSHTYPHLSFP